MRKILIFYGTYGGGHLSAAKSIKEYIEKNYSETEIQMTDCIEYINHFLNKLTTSAYNQMAKKAPWAWKKVYFNSERGFVAHFSNTSNRLMSHKLNKYINEYSPDLIISTHPFSSSMCALLKKKSKIVCPIATVMTDFHIHNQWLTNFEFMDYYFVSNTDMKEDMINLGIKENKIIVSGIPFSERFLASYNTDEILHELSLQKNKFTILFFAGGEFGLGKTKTFEIFKFLVKNFKQLQIIAIAGRNLEMKELFENFVKENHQEENVKVLEFTKKVPELMSISNIVISKPGGLTTTESLIAGLPLLIINPIPGQEEQNAEFLEKSGAAIWIKDPSEINSIMTSLLENNENLENMKKSANALAKPNALKEICKKLLN